MENCSEAKENQFYLHVSKHSEAETLPWYALTAPLPAGDAGLLSVLVSSPDLW